MKRMPLLLSLALPLFSIRADIRLPAIFSDHMVLARMANVPVWGWADPGEEVVVSLNGREAKAVAGADGKWLAMQDLSESAAGPFEMTVQGKNRIAISDVIVGEVWVASGQSNMEVTLKSVVDSDREIAQSTNPNLRQFAVKQNGSPSPQEACEGKWVAASPETASRFTAVGYYFGRALQDELKVPVGIINASWGGACSESWTSAEALDSVPDLRSARARINSRIVSYPEDRKEWVKAFGAWLAGSGREDRAAGDSSTFAAPDASAQGWRPVTIPGTITGTDLPGLGAVWIRAEIDRPAGASGPVGLDLGALDGYESVYWDGEPLVSLSYKDYPGSGYLRRGPDYTIPAEKAKAGRHTLTIRVFAPVSPAKFPNDIRVAGLPVKSGWVARQEFVLPSLSASQLAAVPRPPAILPPPPFTPAYLYNGMIHPIVPYAIRGAIWYQGESNTGRSHQYLTAFPLMITAWRKAWGQGDFPFYFCQLANNGAKSESPRESGWAELREAQSKTLGLPNTGQAVLIDLGESADIHPRNKKDVGGRLALIALARDYGKKIPFSGPVYESMEIEGGKARLSFRHTDGGLAARPVPPTYDVNRKSGLTAPTVRNSPGSELEGFAVCGEDRLWVWADAKVDGDTVLVWSDKVPVPFAVRYGWGNNPTVNLYNGAGLPASPFRTDDFPGMTTLNKL